MEISAGIPIPTAALTNNYDIPFCIVRRMERSGATVRPPNPTFAILGLSHIGSRCSDVPEWSSSLSVSCFGPPVAYDDKPEAAAAASSPMLPARRLDDSVLRMLSAKASRRHPTVASMDRRQSRQPQLVPPAPTSLQVPAASAAVNHERPHTQRRSRSSLNRSLLASESLIIRPLRGSSGVAARSNSPEQPTTRRTTGTRPRTESSSSSRRDVPRLTPPTITDHEGRRGTSTLAGRHLDVFLPSLFTRPTAESDE